MEKIKAIPTRRRELAMPQLIPQDQLSMTYVNKWKDAIEKVLSTGRNITQHPTKGLNPLYQWKKSSVSGAWFIARNGAAVDYFEVSYLFQVPEFSWDEEVVLGFLPEE